MMWRGLEACFWQYADMTNQTLSIKHQGHTVYLGAIELVPLSPAEVAAIEADRAELRDGDDAAALTLVLEALDKSPGPAQRASDILDPRVRCGPWSTSRGLCVVNQPDF